jgi:hypothetical protein
MLERNYDASVEPSRLNKGAQLTPRIVSLCTIMAEQGALRFDQVQRWLGLLSPATERMKEAGLLSSERTRKVVRPWIDQGWLAYKVFFVGQRGWFWLTARGLKAFEVPLRYYEPNPATLAHLYAVNEIRHLLALRRPADSWRSERLLRTEQHAQAPGSKQAHLPDAEVHSPNETIKAIECELTVKSEKRLEEIVFDLAGNARYSAIWYFVSQQAQSAVTLAVQKLPAEHQKRFVLYNLKGERSSHEHAAAVTPRAAQRA